MKALGGAMKDPTTMIEGRSALRSRKGAGVLEDPSGRRRTKAKSLFPDDSKTGDTDALPAAFTEKPI